MTDELEGARIKIFGSAGPKSYSYLTAGGKSDCKNKGTKSSYEINQVLNCNSMLNHIRQELNNPLRTRRVKNIEIKNRFVGDNTKRKVRLEDMMKVWCQLGQACDKPRNRKILSLYVWVTQTFISCQSREILVVGLILGCLWHHTSQKSVPLHFTIFIIFVGSESIFHGSRLRYLSMHSLQVALTVAMVFYMDYQTAC